MFRFPWGDMHSLNLGWFLQKFNELREDWATAEAGIDGALDAEIQKAEDALSDVFAARDAAAASASAANSSALNASQSSLASMDARDQSVAARNTAQQAAADAAASETAAGNSATAAAGSATAAAGSATAAGQSATNAAASETAAGQSASAAAASAASIEGDVSAAESAALKSEGFSVGQQNGVDVGPGSPYYENNAKYFSNQLGILPLIEQILPSVYAPYAKLASGETTRIKIEKNIMQTKVSGVLRTFFSGSVSESRTPANDVLYLDAGTYLTEIAFLEYDTFPYTLPQSIYIVDTGLSDDNNFYRMNLSRSGFIALNTWYRTVSVTIPAGYYAISTLTTGDCYNALGKVKYMVRLAKVESNGELIRGILEEKEVSEKEISETEPAEEQKETKETE